VLFAVWALAAFYGSLGPALIDHLVGSASAVDGGLGLGILAGVASLTTYLLRALPAPTVMLIGTSALIAGVEPSSSPSGLPHGWAFFAGTALAGVGFGAGFQGGIRLVAPLAQPDQRAGVLSVLSTVSYLGWRPRRRGRVRGREGRRSRRHVLRVRRSRNRLGPLRGCTWSVSARRHRHRRSRPRPQRNHSNPRKQFSHADDRCARPRRTSATKGELTHAFKAHALEQGARIPRLQHLSRIVAYWGSPRARRRHIRDLSAGPAPRGGGVIGGAEAAVDVVVDERRRSA